MSVVVYDCGLSVQRDFGKHPIKICRLLDTSVPVEFRWERLSFLWQRFSDNVCFQFSIFSYLETLSMLVLGKSIWFVKGKHKTNPRTAHDIRVKCHVLSHGVGYVFGWFKYIPCTLIEAISHGIHSRNLCYWICCLDVPMFHKLIYAYSVLYIFFQGAQCCFRSEPKWQPSKDC